MLPSARFELHAPHTLPRTDHGDEWVQDGWARKWAGYGTFKALDTRSSTRELGRAAQLTASARSRAIPIAVYSKIVIGSWRVKSPEGRWYEINNRSHSGGLTTLSLTEAEGVHNG